MDELEAWWHEHILEDGGYDLDGNDLISAEEYGDYERANDFADDRSDAYNARMDDFADYFHRAGNLWANNDEILRER